MSFEFEFTKEHLQEIIGKNDYIEEWHDAISNICPNYEIDTPDRLSAFIAQCAHESANFKTLRENLNYRAESLMRVWPKHFPTIEIAQQYAKQPEKIANKAYANRMGNGDEDSGDGWKFCGRGLIQLTGRSNYEAFADSIMMPVDDVPEYLSTFNGAVESACWFWKKNNLNKWADEGDIKTLTKRINGGYIGLEDRIKHYNHAREIIGN